MQIAILILLTLAELVLFVLLVRFFSRLKKSEELLTKLSENQDTFVQRLQTNAQLEKELMQSFVRRQAELQALAGSLEDKAAELRSLLEQAEAISRSPHFLRELIINGKSKGRTLAQLAKATGLSIDEVELILAQGNS